jgi:hypothetical protein
MSATPAAGISGATFNIQATIQNISAANPQIDGDTLIMHADTSGGAIVWSWDAASTLDAAYMPKR